MKQHHRSKVLVIHGAGEPTRRDGRIYWEPLLSPALGTDVEVHAPRMPDPEHPDDGAWREAIAEHLRSLDRPVLVGHSFGASTLLRFLAMADPLPALRGVFLVSTPFWGADFPDFTLSAEHLRRLQSVGPLHFYQSTDDPVVDVSHFRKFQATLPNAVFRELHGRGHGFEQASFPELEADIRATLSVNPDVETLKRFFAAINRNDMQAMVEDFDPQILRIEPEGFDTAGTYRGIAQVQAHVHQGRSTWAEGRCDPERFLVSGDKVVVYLHAWVRLHDATEWMGGRFADGFVLRDGRITEYRTFWERAQALEWAGIDDPDAATP